MKFTKLACGTGLAVAVLFGAAAYATPISTPAPGAVLDLNGQPIPSSYTQYTVNFTATAATTNISFGFRDDPDFINFDSIFVADTNNPVVNLILNGDFEGGTTTSGGNSAAPVAWGFVNPYGVPAEGVVTCGDGGQGGSSCYWADGSVGGYDYITQAISTVIGDTYSISFWAFADNGVGNWSQGNTDIVVYGGAVPSFSVPEPGSLGLFGLGALLLGGIVVMRKRYA